MKVAVTLGKSVSEAQASMDTDEFQWWRAYLRVDPAGGDRVEVAVARLTAYVAAFMEGRRASPSEFMHQWEPSEPDPDLAYERLEAQMKQCFKFEDRTNGD